MDTPAPSAVTNAQLIRLGIFGIAMGLLEAIVVVYLRELYFPEGFRFPLRFISEQMIRTEMLRELCTLVMLIMVAGTATGEFILRFAVFLFVFGIWDIFYYVFLEILLDWPPSLFTWDVLFLIPVTWVGPVLAPVICSFTMIGIGILFILLDRRYGAVRVHRSAWLLMTAGATLIFLSFIWTSAGIIVDGGFYRDLAGLANNSAFQTVVASSVPEYYHWELFAIGEALILFAALTAHRKTARY